MRHSARQIDTSGWLASTWLLFASFLFYVTFVQYALLRHAQLNLGLAESDLLPGFGLLGGLGIVGSLLAGWLIHRDRPNATRLASAAAILSGLLSAIAGLSLQTASRAPLIACFAPLGLLLGMLIVVLLYLFTLFIPIIMRGLYAGGGTALVYLVANMVAIFSDRPEIIGQFDVVLIGANILIVVLFWSSWRGLAPMPAGREGAWPAMVGRLWLLALVVLVDTALFVLVSRSPGPTAILATTGDWLTNGVGHLLAALLAGVLYSRLGWRKLVNLAALALGLLVALFMAHRWGVADLSDPILMTYSMVVGFYTVALFTLFGEETPSDKPAIGIAVGMVLVGWLASPAGIALGTLLLSR